MKTPAKRDRVDSVSQLADQLERDILSGKLAPGDRLPSERDISAQMGVSRSVVREALRRLASLGLIRSAHGSGARVEAPNSKLITTGYQHLLTRLGEYKLEDLGAVRLPLETTIVRLACEKRTDEQIERMKKTQEVLGDPEGDLEAHAKADIEFHAILAEATGNPFFAIVLEPLQELQIASRRRTLGNYGVEIAHRHHAKILKAIVKRDVETAVAAMTEHIEANMRHLRTTE
ncbi:MAG: FadR/GntR family transcriptional regulator [Gemmataceae bacterium]